MEIRRFGSLFSQGHFSARVAKWIVNFCILGHVHRLTDEEARTQRKVDAEYKKGKEQQKGQVGNYNATLGAVSILAAIHGQDKDGSPGKRRRFARKAQKLLDVSQSVASYGLKEAAGAGDDVSSSGDE